MYYKITDKDSELYKKLHQLRTEELAIEKSNNAVIKEVVGDDWGEFLGRSGQQNFWRVTQYTGFAFKHPDRLPAKTWKQHKQIANIYVPDTRTANGRQMKLFLERLPHSSFTKVFAILQCPIDGRFTFPYVEIGKDEVIVVYIGDEFDNILRKFKELIEITSREFDEIMAEEGGEK